VLQPLKILETSSSLLSKPNSKSVDYLDYPHFYFIFKYCRRRRRFQADLVVVDCKYYYYNQRHPHQQQQQQQQHCFHYYSR
jgi:hypothetical protein